MVSDTYQRPEPRQPKRRFGDWFRLRGRSVGGWAFVLHRLTGLVLVFYLFLHFYFLSYLARGPEAYAAMVAAMKSLWITVLEVGLIAATLFHGLNGLRLMLMGLNVGVERHEAMFWGTVVLSALLTLVAAVLML
ncbi:MAG TPA: succinate dehydrogenase, cytochrome b556 subunit [Chloroflexi bacterium]|nr:succinate dehydrogenase, cytochrome b556 subunit [Chloroflexota bacterium]